MELELSKRRARLSGDGGKLAAAALVVDERAVQFMEGGGGGGVVKRGIEDMLEGSKFLKIQGFASQNQISSIVLLRV